MTECIAIKSLASLSLRKPPLLFCFTFKILIPHSTRLSKSLDNEVEQTIRKLTTQRNSSLHYDSDAGAEMAATYHSMIGIVKLHGISICNFIEFIFKNIFNGCRDYVYMVLDKIALATCQC